MLNNHVTSKAGIAKELNLSMPTVLANVNDLLEKRVLEETGECASTGGRKAKSIGTVSYTQLKPVKRLFDVHIKYARLQRFRTDIP